MRQILLIILTFSLNASVWSQERPVSADARKTYEDIKATLGSVPTFLKDFPQEGINGAWADMKGLQLNPNTRISGKYKELIGLAVSAQIPCSYCVYFHTQAAILNGAEQQEIKEAIALAASVRRWSTYLNGTQADEMEFRREVDQILSIQSNSRNRQAMEEKPVVLAMKTPQDAYADINRTLGFVPTYMKNYPQQGIVGVWQQMKGVELNPATAIPGKYKDLIGLAVAAQIPCNYCTYYHTQTAIFNGATKEELQEAVAMAGITRQWSTVLNGQHIDENKFREETDRVMKFLKQKAQKSMTVRN